MLPISMAMIILISITEDAAIPVRTPWALLFVRVDDAEGLSVGTLSAASNEVGTELLLLDVESPVSLGFKVSGSAAVALGDKLGSTTTTTGADVGVVSTGDPVAGITGDMVVAVMDGTDDGSNGDCDGVTVVSNNGAVNG
ncbi:hypothetical protein MHU86_9118 [Fragilaria crotonensis]|nr:hypothetical protein MHU86_9118 [Fragilaria crotonensis]